MWNAVDLDGNPRVLYGKSSKTVDMGAYEYGSFPFCILGIGKEAGGQTELIWRGRPGDTYIVSVCSDLATWQWIAVATVPSQGFTTSWADSALPANRRMFYRIDLE
jgi:hypothetical protein